MKKRILASTMASVMALSAGATQLVSFAAVADYKGLTMTKAELKKFLEEDKEIVDLAENDGIDNFGSISGGNFMKAYEYAAAVASDVDLTDDDATAAFLMLKAAHAALRQYTKQELSALVEQCRPIYDSDNILNDNNDAIYKDGDWTNFLNAFEEADSYTDYDDLRITTDAYEQLDKYKNPSKMETKTKSQINKARQDFEKALAKEFDYEPWQRGTITGSGTKYDGYEVAWGALYQHVANAEDDLRTQYDNFDKIKGLTITSNTDIVAAVKNMETATKVINAFKSTMESGNKSKTNKLINTYYGQLVYEYADAKAADALADFVDKAGAANAQVKVEGKMVTAPAALGVAVKNNYWNLTISGESDAKALGKTTTSAVKKVLGADLSVRCTDHTIYYLVDTTKELINGSYPIVNDGGTYFYTSAPSATASQRVITVNKNTNIKLSDLIEVRSTDIRGGLQDAAYAAIEAAQSTAAKTVNGLYLVSGGVTSGSLAGLVSNMLSLQAEWTALEFDKDAATGLVAAASLPGTTGADFDTVAVQAAITTAISTLASALEEMETALGILNDTNAKSVLNLITQTKETGALVSAANTVTVAQVNAAISLLTQDATSTAIDNMITAAANYNSAIKKLDSAVKGYHDAIATSVSGEISGAVIDAATVSALKTLSSAMKIDISKLQSDLKAISTKINAAGKNFDPNKLTYSDWNNVWDDPKTDKASGNDLSAAAGFKYNVAYTSNKTNGHVCDDTTVSLYKAMTLFEGFINYDKVEGGTTWEAIADLDNNNTVVGEDDSKSISSAAWKLLYNYMKYALEDQFKASTAATYTKRDVQNLYNSSLTLADNTVETTMFNVSHMDLYNTRNAANDWLKQANADKSAYKDNESKYTVSYGNVSLSEATSTEMYEKLKKSYDQLKKEYDGFKYSYGTIAADMTKIAKEIEANKFDAANTKKLTDDLDAVAAAFVKVEVLLDTSSSGTEYEESAVFSDDGLLNVHNRLLTSDGLKSIKTSNGDFEVDKAKGASDRNHSHWVMKEAYETLLADYKAATEAPASQVTNDVDGNGTFGLTDVTALLKLYVDNKTEVAKHDINGDGVVNLQDVTALLKAYISQ